MENYNSFFPPQMLSYSSKTQKWRKQHLDWADSKSYFNNNLIRHSINHKKINYDLVNGVLNMKDVAVMLNPEGIKADYIPDKIQHYPIMNTKLRVLQGEAWKRVFDYRVIITNPTAISEIETKKKDELYNSVLALIQDSNAALYQQAQLEQQQRAAMQQQAQQQPQQEGQPQMQEPEMGQAEQEFQKKLERISEYYNYEWQDIREIRANALLHHYSKEQNFPLIFNKGFFDAETVGEEVYQATIEGGEPVLRRINNMKLTAYGAGFSNKLEDADIIIMEDYWSVGRIFDTYYDSLTKKDVESLDKYGKTGGYGEYDSMGNIDDRKGLLSRPMLSDVFEEDNIFFNPLGVYGNNVLGTMSPFDGEGNVRVLRMYWKSKRKIKKVTSYDPITGDEIFHFYDETYRLDKDKGEKEEIYWINQAWEGTKIGKDIYINIKPCAVQFNKMTNPSVCHFGIIGTIYSDNENKPFSLVDIMKPYAYLYDIVHNRMEKLIARDWGYLLNFDIAKMPRGWKMDEWLYYAKNIGLLVQDSFNEGNIGAATGKLAGALNNNTNGGFNASSYEAIQGYANTLEYIVNAMSEVVGISKQREGQVSNRETVGGVERATLQSSYITEWLFAQHEDTVKRALEAFLECCKIAMKGKSKKFQYITDDYSNQLIEIDGDEFCECDYGLVVDNSDQAQKLNQNLEMILQAGLQNQMISFSTAMKMYSSASLADKQRMIERDEREKLQQAQEAQQQQLQAQQEQIQAQQQIAQAQMQQQDILNQRDNETKIQVAQIQAQAGLEKTAMQMDNIEDNSEEMKLKMAEFEESKRQFDIKSKQADQKLQDTKANMESQLRFNREKLNIDKSLKERQIAATRARANKSK